MLDEQTKIREALVTLADALTGIARTADEKNRERCPYKTVELRCTYAGGCQNQRHSSPVAIGTAHEVRCGGDDLNFSPATSE